MEKNKLKWWHWLLIGIFGLLVLLCVLLGIPYLLNIAILSERKFEVVGEGKDWLMFWATFISAIASFAMVLITWRTLQQNKKIIEEQNRPQLIFTTIDIASVVYLVISNIGNSAANNIKLNLDGSYIDKLRLENSNGFNLLNSDKIIINTIYKDCSKHIPLRSSIIGHDFTQHEIAIQGVYNNKYEINELISEDNEPISSNRTIRELQSISRAINKIEHAIKSGVKFKNVR